MSGLNDAARALIVSKNVPGRVGPELALLHTIVAYEGSDVLGVGALDGTEIKRVFVSPPVQRRGIGSAIVAELGQEARRRGALVLELQASPSSESFYERHGYRSIREERTANGDAEFIHIRMEKRLV